MSALPPKALVIAVDLVSALDPAVGPLDDDPVDVPVQVLPERRRRLVPAPFRKRLPLAVEPEPSRTILPTPERRRHLQDFLEQTIEIEAPVTRADYDPVAREVMTTELRPGRYGKAMRIVRGVATLHRAKEIGDAELRAADRYVREWEIGMARMRLVSLEATRGGTGGDAQGITEAQLDALTSVRKVRQALGLCSEIRLRLMLVEEASFTRMAERLMPGRPRANETLRAQAVILLQQLAEHYAARDKDA